MDPNTPTNTEAELESFRRKWREEVTARTRPVAPAKIPTASSSKATVPKNNPSPAPTHSHVRRRSEEDFDDVTPHAYQDLGEKQHGRRLDETGAQTAVAFAAGQEPSSALEHYESAVEKESAGRLGDSLALYRKAFKVGGCEYVKYYRN
jgi:F-box protein 9